MQIKVHNGRVDLSGETVLENVNIEINTNDRIAVVGRNGCGKTTLLKLLSGKLSLSNEQNDGSFISVSGKPVIGMLDQMTFKDENSTLIDEIRSAYSDILRMKSELDKLLEETEKNHSQENINNYSSLLEHFTTLGGFYFEKEYEAGIKKFGFSEEEKYKPVHEFSGGQRTKIAFLKLLLSKPDLLLLDEPTNHLDIEAVRWLEEYIKNYKKAVVIVSHDRMFLDETVNEVYEIEHGKTFRYTGNYSEFVKKKKERNALLLKQYSAQQKEIARISEVAERFRYKATKAAMAQSKLKQIDRMEKIEAPQNPDDKTFHAKLEPMRQSVKEVLTVTNLCIGFSRSLATVDFSVMRGDRIGIIGGNGLGKSTLLKTLLGKIPALSGSYRYGEMTDIGYFDQQMAGYRSENTILEDFLTAYPSVGDFEARSALGSFLFSGEDVFKKINVLSGGERVRLALCKLFYKRPNVLILDEPTNHMDIASKETLEEILLNYSGTLIFVSHDRYFIKKLSNKILSFENDGSVKLYEYGYEQFLNSQSQIIQEKTSDKPIKEKHSKKTYTTPGKEKAKRERALKKSEEKIALLEEKIGGLKEELALDENICDYLKLSSLQSEIERAEDELLSEMEEWEKLTSEEALQ